MREKGWRRKSEGERRKEKRTGHQRGTAARRHPDDSWSNYVRVHAAGEGKRRNFRERYFGAEAARLRGSRIRLVGKAARRLTYK